MTEAVRVCGLKKSYGTHAVLKGLNFGVNQGEIFGILGINGAGKTTAMECIEGLRTYDEGQINVRGKTGIQLQSASLPEHIRAMEAVRLFAKWNHCVPDEGMLKELGIPEFAKKQYYQLSTGQKRRLHLALALIRDPDLLFLDEPTAGLDVEGRVSLHGLIRKLRENGKTIVMTSHDMAEVESLCDRIGILNGGSLVFLGTVEELGEKVGKQYRISIRTEHGTEEYESEDIGTDLMKLLEQYRKRSATILDLHVDRGSLEQHFMKITKGE